MPGPPPRKSAARWWSSPDGNQGKGVTVNITTEEHLRGLRHCHRVRDNIPVERYMPGNDYRLLVVGDKLVAAARRDPPKVVGDGVHTITELVAQVNLDPRRGSGHATSSPRSASTTSHAPAYRTRGFHAG